MTLGGGKTTVKTLQGSLRDAGASPNYSRIFSLTSHVALVGVFLAMTPPIVAARLAGPGDSNSASGSAKPAASAPVSAIRQVSVSKGENGAEVLVQGNGKLTYHVEHLKDPERVLLDFEAARLATHEKTVPSSFAPVQRIRMSQSSSNVVHVVIDLSAATPYQVQEIGNRVALRFGSEGTTVTAPPASSTPVLATSGSSSESSAGAGECPQTMDDIDPPAGSVLLSARDLCATAVQPTGVAALPQDQTPPQAQAGQKPFGEQQPQPAGARRQKSGKKTDIEPENTRWRTYDLEGVPQYSYHELDPYHQNRLKGDFPAFGENWFSEIDIFQTAIYKSRRNLDFTQEFNGPPAGAQSCAPQKIAEECLHNNFIDENGIFGFEIRHNDDRFFPSDFRIHMDGIADFRHDPNAVQSQSAGNAEIFDAFSDIQIANPGTHNFNQIFLRGGLQAFKSDFQGLIFNDTGLGGRIFGQALKNRLRYDVVYLKLFQRNAVSTLFDFRIPSDHQVLITRFTWEDFLVKGWNSEWDFHANYDPRKAVINANPAKDIAALDLQTYYVSATFNGNLGRFIFNPAVYGVFGFADKNNAGVAVRHDVRAWNGLIDLEYPIDFLKFRFGYDYASGASTKSKVETGFDAISDATVLFGGPFSYWVGEDIKFGAGDLLRANSFFPSLRGTNAQANYENPGLQLVNLGMDATITRRLQTSFNVNYYYFNSLGTFPGVGVTNTANGLNAFIVNHHSGAIEENAFLRWKPVLHQINDLFVIDFGFAVMQPLAGMHDIFGRSTPVYTFQVVPRLVF
jgi:AMIN domain-containing protein